MASLSSPAASIANGGMKTNHDNPPLAASLHPKTNGASAFSAANADVAYHRQITLSVDMPLREQQDQATDLALSFKRFATVLLKADSSLSILNWLNPLQNPITKSGDIAPTKATVEEYYAGMRVLVL